MLILLAPCGTGELQGLLFVGGQAIISCSSGVDDSKLLPAWKYCLFSAHGFASEFLRKGADFLLLGQTQHVCHYSTVVFK